VAAPEDKTIVEPPRKPATSVAFLTPLNGHAQTAAAEHTRFAVAQRLHLLRIKGKDKSLADTEIAKKSDTAPFLQGEIAPWLSGSLAPTGHRF
jgi:hypothetical protein